MAYLIINKKNNKPTIVGSLPKVIKTTNLHLKSLEYYFSQKKEIEYNDEDFRIVKFPDITINKIEISNEKLRNNYNAFLDSFINSEKDN